MEDQVIEMNYKEIKECKMCKRYMKNGERFSVLVFEFQKVGKENGVKVVFEDMEVKMFLIFMRVIKL